MEFIGECIRIIYGFMMLCLHKVHRIINVLGSLGLCVFIGSGRISLAHWLDMSAITSDGPGPMFLN